MNSTLSLLPCSSVALLPAALYLSWKVRIADVEATNGCTRKTCRHRLVRISFSPQEVDAWSRRPSRTLHRPPALRRGSLGYVTAIR